VVETQAPVVLAGADNAPRQALEKTLHR